MTAEKDAREGNMEQLHDTTNKLMGKYINSQRPVKDKDGKPLTEIQGQRNRCVEHFEELLNRPAPLTPLDIEAARTDLPIDVNLPMIQEIRMVIRQMKSGKAERPHSTLAEELKSDVEATTNVLHVLFRRIWEQKQVPKDWK
ncbi:unnamed protein product [Schistosoma curassoni]|uniref:Rna-directed dna polymerase from mobile element jockey-like n=1 Tax=Schistosoma curassoni TaxID=6186 RepID=A0A183JDZ2_9TREM|nr:unnamed protein product [Schistosoma curassoni]